MSRARKTLKRRLFRRDGWKNIYGQWEAHCSFGCGNILTYDTATVDHYPIPRRLGGGWTLDNTRLACADCNNHDGGVMGIASQIMPPGLSPQQRREWWQRHHCSPLLQLDKIG